MLKQDVLKAILTSPFDPIAPLLNSYTPAVAGMLVRTLRREQLLERTASGRWVLTAKGRECL